MKKLYLFFYYLVARHLPMQPFPGYQIGYLVRRWLLERIIRQCGDKIVVKDNCYFGNGDRLSWVIGPSWATKFQIGGLHYFR